MNRMKTLNQMLTDNPNLLSFVVVPTAQAEDLDSATLKTAIIRRCGDVAPYYQKAADFTLFGTMWFNTHSFLFAHALEVWNATYNPIENYDRIEDETVTGTREGSRSGSDTHSGTDTTTTSSSRDATDTHSGTDTTTTSGSRDVTDTHSGTDTTTTSGSKSGSDAHTGTDTLTDNVTRENEIAGFNSSTYSDANKETESGTHATAHGETITKSEQSSGSEALAHGHKIVTEEDTTGSEALAHGHRIVTDEDTTGSEALAHGHVITSTGTDSEETENTRESHIHGNIGVTTAQQMIEAELNLADKFWIYDYIASAFETDNFITVYDSYYESSAWGV